MIKMLKAPTLILLPLVAASLAFPAQAQDSDAADASTVRMIVAKRLGATVYCLADGTPLEKGCKRAFAWRKQGLEIRLPAKEDGTVSAVRTGPAQTQPGN